MNNFIAIDLGRSQIKSIDLHHNRFCFKSIHLPLCSVSTQTLSQLDKDLAARIDNGKSYVYGDTALHLSETDFIIDGLNNSSFITDHSYLYTLFSIAKIISISKENDENINVILGLSYTKEYEFSLTELTNRLKGNHTVEFLDLNETVLNSISFTVTDIYKYLQPLPVIYNLFIKDNLSCDKED